MIRRQSESSKYMEWLKSLLVENLSYKLVSLFIALILWLTILGRRDFVLSKTMDVEILAGAGFVVTQQSVDRIRVRVSGPRTALKKFVDSGFSEQITVDASKFGEGEYDLEIPLQRVDAPFGVKVLQIKPASTHVVIKKSQ